MMTVTKKRNLLLTFANIAQTSFFYPAPVYDVGRKLFFY